ncbi:MAG: hypothetical protein KatS3mg061_0422 [Dehalococcoidia bacterium]|nr:MAG: hypothetical protein KatS3mg061_0422 [Dehalococcoidia bacterium]
MRIAIIGAGYCGLAAVAEWTAAGHQVVATTLVPEQVSRLQAAGARARLARGSDRAQMREVLAGQEAVVISVAGPFGPSGALDLREWEDTYLGTAAVVLAELPGSVRSLLVMSSTNAYGSAGGAASCDEETPATPTKPHEAIVLQADEQYLQAGNGRAVCVLRVGHIYGPPPRDIASQLQRMAGRHVPYPADSAVSLIHRDDVVGASLHLIAIGARGIFNLVDDTPGSRSEFYNQLIQAAELPLPSWDPPGSLPRAFPNAKLKATGYQLRVPTYWDSPEGIPPTPLNS